jgi:hypothetical protein
MEAGFHPPIVARAPARCPEVFPCIGARPHLR